MEEIIGVSPPDLGFGKGFLDMIPKREEMKEKKIDKLDLSKS